ncbi:hypothetical protein Ade02nite_35020 [Paractinoplanes deccanensis]|uniref:Polysaccharide chain length determinant N-terminal domain-containing protein n=1 Tax=Paractinoplanes deccanensis TaxID=113561 RepID=A0ABQ3Y4D0_9ACTN|nr:CpsD/CapB family tyrosine-protein kinase [Actinoplanes deccanensis]GID74861.1 hypothetical protein Ade02nite_35020 [Actinoplanes deccanensis]
MTTKSEPRRLLRGHGWLILLLTLAFAAAAYGLSLLEPQRYRAEATVVVEPRLRTNITPVPADPDTESEIVRSAAVLRPAATGLGVSRQALADGLRVTPARAGTSLTIGYEATSAATARTRAQAVAGQYVSYRNASTGQYGIAASLVTPAATATRVTWLPPWAYVVIGAAVGLLTGLIVAAVRGRHRVRGRVHFEQLTGLPVLATIPRARRSHGPGAPLPVLLRSPASADAESYRYLRARLEPRLEGPATVLVTSAHEGEGRSTTAANLAIVLAQSGREVVLIDTDVRGPVLHHMFELSRDRGLTGLLTGDISGASALLDGPVPRLRLMAAGPDQEGAPDLLAASFSEMLRELKNDCDVIVLDSAPALHVADAVALAALSDLVLLVADYDRLTRATARRAAHELTAATAGAVAAVLIGVPERDGGLIPRTRAGRAPAPVSLGHPSTDQPAPAPQPAPGLAALAHPLSGAGTPTPLQPTTPGTPSARPPTTPGPPSARPLTAPGTPSAQPPTAPGTPSAQPPTTPGTFSAQPSAAAGPSAAPARPATATGPAFARPSRGGPAAPQPPAQAPAPSSDPSPSAAASSPAQPTSAPPVGYGPPPVTAKAAVPKPRVYTSAAAAEASARVQAKVTADQKRTEES